MNIKASRKEVNQQIALFAKKEEVEFNSV